MANKSKARQKFLPLQSPEKISNFSNQARENWISKLCRDFVQPSNANKAYYKVVIELLWPKGKGVPGPYVTEDAIRDAINNFRLSNKFGKNYQKPYIDVFRRVRELQGEEGLIGVARQGKTYQLVDLKLGPKRVPRTKLSEADWQTIKNSYSNSCAVCKRKEPEVRFQQDHKVPRTREGGDGLGNWQPLCDECNNFKSVSCRACTLDCEMCCWAFPEKYAPIVIDKMVLEKVHQFCEKNNLNANNWLAEIIKTHLN
jgi:hypothetical protein